MAEFYSARSKTSPPLPWTNFAPPYSLLLTPRGVSSIQTHRDFKITQKTAWFLNHRIREAFSDHGLDDEGEPVQFTGPIEVDETYIGGNREQQAL